MKVKHPPCCIITSKLKKWNRKSFLLMGTMLKLVRWETLPKIMCNPSLKKVKMKKSKVGNIFDEKNAFVPCMALFGLKHGLGYYLRVFMNLWGLKKKEVLFYIHPKKHMLLHSFWNVKRIYSEWRRLLLTSCICTVQPVWEMRIVHLNWTQICKCTSTGFISMKNFFLEKVLYKKRTST